MPALLKFAKPTGEAERATQTTLDTIEINPALVAALKSPPFQRDMRVNEKVRELTEEVRHTGVLPGILTLGMFEGQTYVVDGQHRLQAFIQAAIPICYADMRLHYFSTMAAMAAEYVRLNSQLVRLRPDDILKGLEQSNPHLQRIRKQCPYVGYDAVRRHIKSPVLSMSTLLRVWFGTRMVVPALGASAVHVAGQLDDAETDAMMEFLQTCFAAWHRDVEYSRLWGSLNLLLCGWLWRHVVKGEASKGQGRGQTRSDKLSSDQFKRGMLALSANSDYLEWLVGRRISDHDRAPAYRQMKTIMAARYLQDTKDKLRLPSPDWAK